VSAILNIVVFFLPRLYVVTIHVAQRRRGSVSFLYASKHQMELSAIVNHRSIAPEKCDTDSASKSGLHVFFFKKKQ